MRTNKQQKIEVINSKEFDLVRSIANTEKQNEIFTKLLKCSLKSLLATQRILAELNDVCENINSIVAPKIKNAWWYVGSYTEAELKQLPTQKLLTFINY